MTKRITKSSPISFRLHRSDEELFQRVLDTKWLSASEVARNCVTEWLRQQTENDLDTGTGYGNQMSGN